MADTARRRMTPAAFFAWLQRQERRHELVDGEPVMMAGANQRHNLVVTNTLLAVGNRLKAGALPPLSRRHGRPDPGGQHPLSGSRGGLRAADG